MRQEAVLRAPWATDIKEKIRNLSGLHEAGPLPERQQEDLAMPGAEVEEQQDMFEMRGFEWQADDD
eukprot:15647353-Heterocapsa_arctica.AAC.1